MELTRQQIQTLALLAECFCHAAVQEVDIIVPHDAPDGWARVHIIPYYFVVDREGDVFDVQERHSPPPGYPNAVYRRRHPDAS